MDFRTLSREITQLPPDIPEIFGIFWHNFGTRNARKSNKGSKDSHYILESNKTLSHKIDSLERRLRHQNTRKTYPKSIRHPGKTPNPKLK